MRPNRLTLTAFGPYLAPETINFDALKPHDLFVISGSTGAGKTSLFDALSYALFGEASGEDRDAKTLRSDFADDETPTTVELIFTLRGERYRIFRQLPYTKSGNRSETPGRAEIYRLSLNGAESWSETPAVDRQIPREVNAKVHTLLGLTSEQFNQLILLPQGEYKRFLTSSTKEKEEILRTVFNTQIYNDLIAHLKEQRDDKKGEYEALNREQNYLLASIESDLPRRDAPLFAHLEEQASGEILQTRPLNIHQALTGLEQEIHFYNGEIARLESTTKQLIERESAAQKALHEGEQLNQKFAELKEAKAQLTEHNAHLPNIEKKREQIALAERAQPLEIPHAEVTRLREEARKRKIELQAAENQFKTQEEALKSAQIAQQKEQENAPKLAEHERELYRLEALTPEITLLAEKAHTFKEIEASYSSLEATLKEFEAQNAKQKRAQTELAEEIATLEPQTEGLSQKLTEQSEMNDAVKLFEEIEATKQRLATQKEALTSAETAYRTQKREFEKLQNRWLQNQALQLAATLTPNEPCPVCGSLEHPAHQAENTSSHNSGVEKYGTIDLFSELEESEEALPPLSEAEYNRANSEYQSANSAFIAAKAEADYTRKRLDELYQKSALLPPNFSNMAEARANLQSITEAVNKIQIANKKLTQLRQQQRELTTLITQKEAEIEPKRSEFDRIKNNRLRLEAELESLSARIPKHLQNQQSFAKALETQTQLVATMRSAKERADRNLNEAQTALTEVKSLKNQLTEQYRTLVEAGESARAILDQALKEAEFRDEAAFLAAKLSPDRVQNLRNEVNSFTQKSAILENQIAQLSKLLKEAVPADLEALTQKLADAREKLDQAKAETLHAKQYQKRGVELKNQLEKNHQKIEEMAEAFGRLEELYNIVRGENPLKLSFERYLLIEYFDRVIEAANLRLRRMTNGQFELNRSEEIAKRNVQSGLDLNVYDAYTGQDRDVKTLSGGEKFKASLALSLGMADLIQSYQGGISIDTLFIDEGFGSLDEESLQGAIDILIDLQKSGRMIGVISHVDELKQTLPARIEVTKSKSGFSRTELIVE